MPTAEASTSAQLCRALLKPNLQLGIRSPTSQVSQLSVTLSFRLCDTSTLHRSIYPASQTELYISSCLICKFETSFADIGSCSTDSSPERSPVSASVSHRDGDANTKTPAVSALVTKPLY